MSNVGLNDKVIFSLLSFLVYYERSLFFFFLVKLGDLKMLMWQNS